MSVLAKNIRAIEGNFANFDGSFYGRAEIDESTGTIKKITEPLGEADIIVEKGIIFPGFVDLHVHAREDTSKLQVHKEDFDTAAQAALQGGVVCAADMPNNPAAPIDDATYLAKKNLAEDKPINFLLYAAVGPGTRPLSFAVPYKVFMGPSVGELFFKNFAQLEQTVKHYEKCFVSFHCENPAMLQEYARPPEAEISAIEFALLLIEKYKLQGNICHCSTKEGIEKIKNAKLRGVPVTCEVTPHHLYFDASMLTEKNRKWLQVNPPVRSRGDRLALIEALRDGTIDFLASDHAPHTRDEKEKGVSGMPHLDTYGAFATWLMEEHNFTPQDIARICAYNPGRFVNRFDDLRYGKIEEGYVASFTIIDPVAPATVSTADLKTKCKWSPFEGVEFPGQVLYTIHKGNLLYTHKENYKRKT